MHQKRGIADVCVAMLIVTAMLFPWPASAAYAPGTPTSFCQSLPDSDRKDSAIFLGIVRQVVTPERRPPPAGGQPVGAPQSGRRRVGDPPSTVEMRYPTARFQVLENFVGVESGEFEVRMSSHHFVDGIPQQVPPFAVGEAWLVEAHRDQRDKQWTTSFGTRTKLAAEAGEDLRVLHMWAAGQHLPATVAGEVYSPDERRDVPGVQIYLRGEDQSFSSTTDSVGLFRFENLPAGIYEATVVLPPGARGSGPMKIDLTKTKAWCARVVFLK
jgi:hypothetical protein